MANSLWRGGFACPEHWLQSSGLGSRHQLREDSPRGRMHPASHTSADGLHSGWIARVTRFRQTPKSEPNSNFPLLVFLHGAGQSADEMFDYLGTAPEEAGVAVLAPNARDNTWDAIGGSFGPDVKFLNHALELVFEMQGNAGD